MDAQGGVEIGAVTQGRFPGLLARGRGFATVAVKADFWDSATAQSVSAMVASLPSDSSVVPLPASGSLPATFSFKTREGGVGLLQITGFADNPRGVKVRYKLVHSEGKRTVKPSDSALQFRWVGGTRKPTYLPKCCLTSMAARAKINCVC
jgi:hypothetical protein